MAEMENGQKRSGRLKPVLFTLLGAILGALGQYLLTLDQQRLELLREARRDAYISFLDAQALLDLQKDPVKYATDTAGARKRIAIYGDKSVVEALARYWRQNFERPVCCGALSKLKDDVAIYQSMRRDIMPWLEDINEADMMLLHFLCRMPESEAQVKPCPAAAAPAT